MKDLNIYARLNAARAAFHSVELKKTGQNTFAKYKYFELTDFLSPGMKALADNGLCPLPVTFGDEFATMTIVNVDNPSEVISFTSPMSTLSMKGTHPIQNMGAIETYQRRYLWIAALEIMENDIVDSAEPEKPAPKPKTLDDGQVAEIQGLLEAHSIDAVTFCKTTKINSVPDMLASDFEAAKGWIVRNSKAEKKDD